MINESDKIELSVKEIQALNKQVILQNIKENHARDLEWLDERIEELENILPLPGYKIYAEEYQAELDELVALRAKVKEEKRPLTNEEKML